MKVILDLNVILDVVLDREPWVAESRQVWNAHQSGHIDGWMAATELTNLFYIVRRLAGEPAARRAVRLCLGTFGVIPVALSTLEDADRQSGVDFEDNVCIACATAEGIDLIVTRDSTGFGHSPIETVSPAELITRLPGT